MYPEETSRRGAAPRAARVAALALFVLVAAAGVSGASAETLENVGDSCDSGDIHFEICGSQGLACVNDTCGQCVSDASCPDLYVCKPNDDFNPPARLCERYAMFEEFRFGDAAASVLTFMGAMLAAGGGIGGGGLFVPLFILLIGLTPYEAVPLSQAMIFGGGIVNYIMNAQCRHPLVPSRQLINYEAAIMLEPLMLAGTVVGVTANTVFPKWLLVVLLTEEVEMTHTEWVAAASATGDVETYHHVDEEEGAGADHPGAQATATAAGAGQEEEEHEEEEGADRAPAPTAPSPDSKGESKAIDGEAAPSSPDSGLEEGWASEQGREDEAPAKEGDSPLLESSPPPSDRPGDVDTGVSSAGAPKDGKDEFEEEREALEAINGEHLRPMAWVMAVLVTLVVVSLMRGGRAGSESIIGVSNCTPASWLLALLSLCSMLAFTAAFGRKVLHRHRRRVACGYKFVEGDVHWTRRNVVVYPALATTAGIAGGLLGIGGGMIMGPLLLELGLLPATTSATSALTVLVSAAAGTLQFVIIDALLIERAIWYFALGIFATYLGQTAIDALVKKYQSTAVIVFTIVLVMAGATVLMAIVGVIDIVHDVRAGRSLGFRTLC